MILKHCKLEAIYKRLIRKEEVKKFSKTFAGSGSNICSLTIAGAVTYLEHTNLAPTHFPESWSFSYFPSMPVIISLH